jgi:hypothetical protein
MSDSLKDQLLALGLAAKKPGRKKQGKPRAATAKEKSATAEISLDQAYRIRSKDDRQQKEQAIADKRGDKRADQRNQ